MEFRTLIGRRFLIFVIDLLRSIVRNGLLGQKGKFLGIVVVFLVIILIVPNASVVYLLQVVVVIGIVCRLLVIILLLLVVLGCDTFTYIGKDTR